MWIQLLPDGDGASKMRLTVRAELNMFIRKMIESKLKEGVEQLAEMLSKIPYGA
jgi:carbon monoxide dehydrogenase subunit G